MVNENDENQSQYNAPVSDGTDLSQTFVNGDVRLHRRNRSRRHVSEFAETDETKEALTDEKEIKEQRNGGNIETPVNLEENQQRESSENGNVSVVGSSVGADEMRETNVRDNNTSRPPPSTNPLEALQRLTALLDRMLRELSTFGQKFTLRMIRMTERKDVEQMPDLMKDFEISPQKPIFFIAGGLRILNAREVLQTVSSLVAANLTDSVPINETGLVDQPELSFNSTQEEPEPEVGGTTIVPILRPSSSLPVESGDGEITTEVPEINPESDDLDGDEIPTVTETEPVNVTSSTQNPLHRNRISIPGYDEYNFLPIPGRQARTENPYDNEEEFELLHDDDETSESVDRIRNDESPVHLPPVVGFTSSYTSNSTPAPAIDQSHLQRNDEISLNDSKAITYQTSRENGESTAVPQSPARTVESSSFSTEDIASVPASSTTDGVDDGVVVPLTDSITIHEQIKETERSNGQRLQGGIINRDETSNSPISVLPGQLKIENNKPISSFMEERNRNLVRETSIDEFELSKPIASSMVVLPLVLEIVSEPVDLLFQDAEDENEKLVASALPIEVFQVVEKRSFHPYSTVGGKQNTAQKGPVLHNMVLMKDTREVSANQQLLNSELNAEKPISLDDMVSSPFIVDHVLVSDNVASEPHNIVFIEEAITVPVSVEGESNSVNLSPEDRNAYSGHVETSNRVVEIKKPLESNQDDPQYEIKAAPQIRKIVDTSTTHIPTEEMLKETLPTSNNAEDVSLTSAELLELQIQQRTISSKPTTINNILVEDLTSQPNPIGMDSQHESQITPILLHTQSNNTPVTFTGPQAFPDVILDGEQTRNKQPSFSVVGENENQADLVVGEQTKVDGVVMKKVGVAETKVEMEREKEQVSSNQATFHAPTDLEREIPIIDHVAVVRGADTVDLQDVQGETDSIDTSFKNTETVSAHDSENSDASATEKIRSIVAPIVSDNGEVRNPIESSISPVENVGEGNDDILSSSVGKENLIPTQPIISHESSNAVRSDEVVVPLVDSVGTNAPKEDVFIAGSLTEHLPATVPLLVSGSSKESIVPVQDITAPSDPLNSQPLHLQEVEETELRSVPDMDSVNDLPKIEHENVDSTVVKIPPVLHVLEDVINAPVEVSEHDHDVVKVTPLEEGKPELVKIGKDNINPVTLVSPDTIPIDDLVTKVDPVEPEIPDVVKVTPVVESDIVKIIPIDIPSIDIDPRNTEVENVDATVDENESGGVAEKPNDNDGTKESNVEVETDMPVESIEPAVEPDNEQEKLVATLQENIPTPLVDPDTKSADSDVPALELSENSPTIQGPDNLEDLKGESAVVSSPESLVESVMEPTMIDEPDELVDPVLKPAVIPEADLLVESILKPADVIPETDSLVEPILKPADVIPEPDHLINTLSKPDQLILTISTPDQLIDTLSKPDQLIDTLSKPDAIPERDQLINTLSKPDQLIDTLSKPDAIPEPDQLVETLFKPPVFPEPVEEPFPNHVAGLIFNPPVPTNFMNPFVTPDYASPVQPVAAPMIPQNPYLGPRPTFGGDGNIIATLPQNPDPSFGVNPIATQPHLQMPGFRPNIPERPHPDITYMTQNVDTNPALFYPPTAPVIVHSPPVYSGYSPAAYVRKQQQMIQNYFHGMFY